MPPPRRALALRQAFVLGLVQGPTELLPVSSSAHTILLPHLACWPYAELDAGVRKSFEVSLHAGAALALAIAARGELLAATRRLRERELAWLALACAPAALAGLLLGDRIERRLGGPRSTAAALVLGGGAMALADTRAPRRSACEACPRDALAIGVAQALALIPGVSRNGAALAAARALGFSRADAHALSWRAAAPVMVGASMLRAARAFARPLPSGCAAMLAAGACAAFCSTLACARVLRAPRFREAPLAPYALYRAALAALAAHRAQ